MSSLPGLNADVYFGDAEQPLPNWRTEADQDTAEEPEDELDEERLAAVRSLLGFDPDGLNNNEDGSLTIPAIPSSPFRKSLGGYAVKEQCHWVTMPADGPGGGGSSVCIDGSGSIRKGPAKLAGKKPDELKKPGKPKKPSTPKVKPSPFKQPEKPKPEESEQFTLPEGYGDEGYEDEPISPSSKPAHVGKPIKVSTKPYNVSKSLDAFGKKTIDGLKPAQIDALNQYSDYGYTGINSAMRDCPPEFECVEEPQRKQMELIEAALAKAPPLPEPTTVYRGFNNSPEVTEEILNLARQVMENGGIYRMPSITSTSMDPAVPYLSFGSSQMNRTVIFQIQAKKGLYINSISEHNTEHEVLQSAKTRYRVAGVEEVDFVKDGKSGGVRNVIYLEELD